MRKDHAGNGGGGDVGRGWGEGEGPAEVAQSFHLLEAIYYACSKLHSFMMRLLSHMPSTCTKNDKSVRKKRN